MHRVHHDEEDARERLSLDLDEIARQGAQRMLACALQAEVDAYLKAAQGERDEHTGHALVVRNGYHNQRQVLCGAGAIEVKAPRVNDRRAKEVQERDFAALHAPLCEGYGGLAAALPARAL